MARYIDLDKIPESAYLFRDALVEAFENADIADTVEVIRCKDCKHWREGDVYSYCHKLFNCGVLDVYDYMRAENDFCSYAEKRSDDKTNKDSSC